VHWRDTSEINFEGGNAPSILAHQKIYQVFQMTAAKFHIFSLKKFSGVTLGGFQPESFSAKIFR
jgi:hypothetical protein